MPASCHSCPISCAWGLGALALLPCSRQTQDFLCCLGLCLSPTNFQSAALQRQLFILYPFLDLEDNPFTPPSSPVLPEQPVAIKSCIPVLGFIPPSSFMAIRSSLSCCTVAFISGAGKVGKEKRGLRDEICSNCFKNKPLF